MKHLFTLITFLFLFFSSYASVWTVDSLNNAGFGSLRASIDSAQANDTIRFNPFLLANGSDSLKLDSAINITRNVTIHGLYSTLDTLYISGQNTSRIFYVDTTNKVVFDSLVLVNGAGSGGAIHFLNSDSLFVSNCTLTNNGITGSTGGGIYLNGGRGYSRIINSSITNNTSYQGGGVYLNGNSSIDCKITSCNISNNVGNLGSGVTVNLRHYGTSSTNITVEDCNITNNTGGLGFKLIIYGSGTNTNIISNLNLIRSDISNNSWGGVESFAQNTGHSSSVISNLKMDSVIVKNNLSGSGIRLRAKGEDYGTSATAHLEVLNSIVEGNGNNVSGSTGGIYCSSSTNGKYANSNSKITVIGSTLSGNLNSYSGGAISNNALVYGSGNSDAIVDLILKKSTIAGNTTSSSGAIYNFAQSSSSTAHPINTIAVENSTIANNTTSNANQYKGIKSTSLSGATGYPTDSIYIKGSVLANHGGKDLLTVGGVHSITSGGNNIFGSTLTGTVASDQSNISSTLLNLGVLANNGGFGKTRLPLNPSVAINNGSSTDLSDAQNGPIIGIRDIGSAESCIQTSVQYLQACDSLTWINGTTYYASNYVDFYSDTTSMGCDSIIKLNLTIHPTQTITHSLSACDSLTWSNGVTYYASTSGVIDTSSSIYGCDSINILNLTIHYTHVVIDTITACDSVTWINGVTYYTSIVGVSDTLINMYGCDSINVLDLTLNTTQTSTDFITACDSLTWINGITYYSNISGIVDTLIGSTGCDSIVTLDLTIHTIDNSVSQSVDTISANEIGATYQWIDCSTSSILVDAISKEFVPSITGTYAVEITKNGCMDTSNCTLVNVCDNAANYSHLLVSNGEYVFTNGSSGTFTDSHWAFGDGTTSSQNSPTHTFIANGDYVVVLAIHDNSVLGGGCTSYFSDTILVRSVPVSTICNAGWAVFADSNTGGVTIVNNSTGTNLTYHWDFGDGDTSNLQYPTHTYATNGPFNLCLTVDNGLGCVDSYCDSIDANGVVFKNGFVLNVTSNQPLGINHIKIVPEVIIYPNPTTSILNVETTDFTIQKIIIIDATGQLVKTVSSNFKSIPVGQLPTGIYHIELIGNNTSVMKTFIKE